MPNEEKVPFEIMERVEIGNLEDVKEVREIFTPAKDVRFELSKCKSQANRDKTFLSLNLELKIVDEDYNEGKHIGRKLFQMIAYWADPTVYQSDFFKRKQHLLPIKFLLTATEMIGRPVEDQLCIDLVGCQVKGTIVERNQTIKNENGERVVELDADNKPIKRNEVIRFKSAA